MTTINGVSNAAPTTGAVPGGNLTPDAMMSYCASQLNHLDDNIQAEMAKQQAARNLQDKLGTLKGCLSGHQLAGSVDQRAQVIQAFKAAYDALPPNDPAREAVAKSFGEYVVSAAYGDDGAAGTADAALNNLATITPEQMTALAHRDPGNPKNDVSAEEMQGRAAEIDPIINDIGKGAELDMINLQSLVSQRQMAVQITTQVISKMNDTYASITASIGK